MAKSQISSSSSLLSLTSAQVLAPLLFISGVNNIKLRQKKLSRNGMLKHEWVLSRSHRKGYFYSKESFIKNVKRRCNKSESGLVQHELTFRKNMGIQERACKSNNLITLFSMFFFVQNSDQLEIIGCNMCWIAGIVTTFLQYWEFWKCLHFHLVFFLTIWIAA